MENIKTLIINKKGRKYFDCVIGGYKAKLVINDVSANLENDRVVKLRVADLSERSKYGTSLKFEPLEILEDRDAEALRQAAAARKLAEKWLGYAESDAKAGMSRTNAIKEARRLCKGHDQFADRLAALEAEIERNSAKEHQAKAEKIERRQNRILFPVSAMPAMNTPVQHGGATLVFESAGKSFRISEDHPSIEGSHLLGHEGELGCYCYYKKIS